MYPEIDRTDRAIIKALQENARLSNVELSQKVNLSPSACLRRVANLEKNGVISGYHAELGHQQLGYDVIILVQVALDGQSAKILEEFEKAVLTIPNLMTCFFMAGGRIISSASPPKMCRIMVKFTAITYPPCPMCGASNPILFCGH